MAEAFIRFISLYKPWVVAGSVALFLLIAAVVIIVFALKRAKKTLLAKIDTRAPIAQSLRSTDINEHDIPVSEPRVKRARLSVGDTPSPWTQGVYERHSPEAKIARLLPAFGFDEAGSIHRAQDVGLVDATELANTLKYCNTAVGVGVHGAYATLLLWHAGDARYATMALKVVSHAQLADEQKSLIRFLFQDVVGKKISPDSLPQLAEWPNPSFQAALQVYTLQNISPKLWSDLQQKLPPELARCYDLEVARKSPARLMYREAAKNPLFGEALYQQNLETLARYLNPKRWQRLTESDKASRFLTWATDLPIDSVRRALLVIANPDVFEKDDLQDDTARKVAWLVDAADPREWLFHEAPKPPLFERRQYFKFFCLFGRHAEAVRCFATLGIFRRDRTLRLYFARSLYSGEMLHEAWAEMSSLLTEYPRDAAILNEAGIYAHKLGRYEEAAQVFATARGLFPQDATIAYNEAVFTEQYGKVQVEAKWSAVQKLTAPPVVEA